MLMKKEFETDIKFDADELTFINNMFGVSMSDAKKITDMLQTIRQGLVLEAMASFASIFVPSENSTPIAFPLSKRIRSTVTSFFTTPPFASTALVIASANILEPPTHKPHGLI